MSPGFETIEWPSATRHLRCSMEIGGRLQYRAERPMADRPGPTSNIRAWLVEPTLGLLSSGCRGFPFRLLPEVREYCLREGPDYFTGILRGDSHLPRPRMAQS